MSGRIIPPTGGRVGFRFLCAVLAGIAFGVIAVMLGYGEWAPYVALGSFFFYGLLVVVYAKTHRRRFRRRRFR